MALKVCVRRTGEGVRPIRGRLRRCWRGAGVASVITLLLLGLPAGPAGAQTEACTWSPQPNPESEVTGREPQSFRAVSFPDVNNGWAVGRGGTILATTDGGENWVSQVSNTTQDLQGVSFVDANNGWAVGFGGTILATTDGGATWVAQDSGVVGDHQFRAVHFVDANNGWAVGYLGFSEILDDVIVHTTDGGATWTEQATTVEGQSLWAVDFVNDSIGWAVGDTATILATTDGGSSWTLQDSGLGVNSLLLRGVSFVDANTGWAVGANSIITATTDGGATWTPQNSGSFLAFGGVDFVSQTTGWGAQAAGSIRKTTDGGATWVDDPTNLSSSLKNFTFLNGIDFVNETTGWAVGDYGTIIACKTAGPPPVIPEVSTALLLPLVAASLFAWVLVRRRRLVSEPRWPDSSEQRRQSV